MTPGWVYLVGAGPGDPALLTLRALDLIRTAEVVAHDELVPSAILTLARPGAEIVSVGRRRGCGSTAYRLHPAVLARARAGRRVVRLKSGDPFVFGRGGEEVEELAEAGIPFEVVPGVSAALGAAAAARIPLTHRECASDVTFVSGHDADGSHRSWTDWGHLAAGRGTVVLFMAGRQLEANLTRLVSGGRSSDTPAAYVVSATMHEEEVIVGTLGDLAERARGVDPKAPALVIVGDVVARRVPVAAHRAGPLAGRRILVARARPGSSDIAARLRRLAAEVLEAPLVEATVPGSYAQLDAALERLYDFGVVLFDSPEGVEAALRRAEMLGIRASGLASTRVVAIGDDVGAALASEGLGLAATIPGSCQAALTVHRAALQPGPVLLVTREGGRPSLRADLEALDLSVEWVAAYRYVHRFPATMVAPLNVVVLPSSSAAIALLESELGSALRGLPMVAMGPRSEEAARRFGVREVVRAPRDDVAALVACVVSASWVA
jgi:uroporphyrinogen III methyltransferase / synthase